MTGPGMGHRYVLHQRLGAGGMGVVHLGSVISAAGERLVAIKQLFAKGEVDEDGRRRLIAEARLVFQLTHANIAQVLDLGENERGVFVVMEYVRGCDLRTLLGQLENETRPLDVAMVAYIGREVARALDFAHRHSDATGRPLGVVHGDVTPQNILLSIEGEVKLADFGMSRAIGTSAPGEGLVGGTPGFMAPEAHRGHIDHRADIFSLGATLHRALTAQMPGPIGPDADVLAQCLRIAPDLRDIVRRAVAPEATARHLSAAELERALAAWLARRHPDFTPSALARVVKRHKRDGDFSRPRRSDEFLAMETLLDRREPPQASVAVSPRLAMPGGPGAGTATVSPPRRRRGLTRLAALLGAIGLVAGVVVTWALLFSDARARSQAVVFAPDPTPAAPPPAIVPSPPAEPLAEVEPPAPDAPEATEAPPGRPRRAGRHDEPGFLTVNSSPWGAVFVDGKEVAAETPLYRHPLKPGRHHVSIRWGHGDRRSKAREILIKTGEHATLGFRE